MNEKMRIGWIGLGRMGIPMSKRILNAGYPLTVWNRTREKTKELVNLGAKVANSCRELASQSDIVISMILDDAALEAITFGDQGVLAGASQNTIFTDMSTVSPAISAKVAQACEQKNIKYLRAVVSGSTLLAEKGALTIYVSGDEDTYKKCLPIYQVMGKTFYVGDKEQAKALKLLINMMVATTSQMYAEALVFGEHAGLNWKTMVEAIRDSVVGSPLIGYKTKPILERNFTPAFTVEQMEKDLDLALEEGKKMGTAMPLTSLVRQMYGIAKATGKKDLDYFSLLLLMEELSGIKK